MAPLYTESQDGGTGVEDGVGFTSLVVEVGVMVVVVTTKREGRAIE